MTDWRPLSYHAQQHGDGRGRGENDADAVAAAAAADGGSFWYFAN